ncbi:MAG: M20 aminoacylase family protein [Geminicoccaceae bacterium]
MEIRSEIASYADELTAIRRDLHEHPELGFEEVRTSGVVAEKLASWGVEVHRGLGKTGVIGIIEGRGGPGRSVGLRADMDALPIEETTNLPWRSKTPGVFHGCGHDGHTTMLLGAARYLAGNRDFSGRVVLIFQPAEEGLGGARAMLADGLFEQFPCDEIYGIHNSPYHGPGEVGIRPGAAMAGADFFDITIHGRGSHGAMPQVSRDPIYIATSLVQSLQSVISRNATPTDPGVLSVTQFHSGTAYNVIPDTAVISGTMRMFSDDLRALMRQRMKTICKGVAESFEVEIDVDIRNIFDVLINDADLSQAVADVAGEVVGKESVSMKNERVMGSEDFADMLRVVPGAYFTLGHAGDVPLHNPGFVLDDGILPVGASIFARIAETRLAV